MTEAVWNCRSCHKSLLEAKEDDTGTLVCPHCHVIIHSKRNLWRDGKEKFMAMENSNDQHR